MQPVSSLLAYCARHRRRLATAAAAAAVLTIATAADAALTLLKLAPADPATFVGTGGYSADGLGQNAVGGTIQAEVPAGSTVVQAYLYGTYFVGTPLPADLAIDFDGSIVALTQISTVNGLSTARADVTAQVAAKVGGGGGITDFAVDSDPPSLDGVALVVIFSNPSLPLTTIAVLDGSASQSGDTTTFTFGAPLDKTVAGFSAVMSLGSGFSYQGGLPGHACGGGQTSVIEVNGQLLTDCAGNFDDGEGNNGGLITVGGVGDSTNNPAPPSGPAEDDELYDLEPFLSQGDLGITVDSSNPSFDDNLFLLVIAITAEAQVTTEVCDDGIDNDGDGLVDGADPDCVVVPVCGNGVLEGGEACDPPGGIACPEGSPADAFLACNPDCTCPAACVPVTESCNNMQDDDCDDLVDCLDPDCGNTSGTPVCQSNGPADGTECATPAGAAACTSDGGQCLCDVIHRDPTIIRFGTSGPGNDLFKSHGRVTPGSAIDVSQAEVGWVVTNRSGVVYSAVLHPGDLKSNRAGTRFVYKDLAGKHGGGVRSGIYKASIRITRDGGSYGYKVISYGDLSKALDADMALQFYLGSPQAGRRAEPLSFVHDKPWTRQPWGWKSTAFD